MSSRKLRLSAKQQCVLELLLSGNTISAAAERAGVSRRTIHNWLRGDAEFISAREEGITDLANAATARLHAMTESALNVIDRALQYDDPRVALTLLRGLGLLPGTPPLKKARVVEEVQLDLDAETGRLIDKQLNSLLSS